jgi:hypothetical protein
MHVETLVFWNHPAGHPAMGTQNLFVASHHANKPQSEADVAHTVDAASLGSMQQHKRANAFDAVQVEDPTMLAKQVEGFPEE